MDEAIACREANESKVILFNLCGHGLMDLSAYDAFFSGKLEDYEFDNLKLQVPSAAGYNVAHATWRIDGTVRVRTQDRDSGARS